MPGIKWIPLWSFLYIFIYHHAETLSGVVAKCVIDFWLLNDKYDLSAACCNNWVEPKIKTRQIRVRVFLNAPLCSCQTLLWELQLPSVMLTMLCSAPPCLSPATRRRRFRRQTFNIQPNLCYLYICRSECPSPSWVNDGGAVTTCVWSPLWTLLHVLPPFLVTSYILIFPFVSEQAACCQLTVADSHTKPERR